MSKTPDKKDVSKILVSMADGSTWEAIWDETGLKLVKEVTPPPGGGGGSGDPFEDLLDEFDQEQESKDNEEAEQENAGQDESEDEPEDEPEGEQPASGSGGSPPPKEIPPSELEPISDSAFKSRLMSIMRDNMYDRRTPNKSRGKLDMKRLPRVKTGATNVFTQKEASKNKKYSVVLCVDTSSSMDEYNKNNVAADSTALLVRTLQLAGIDVAVVGFGPVIVLKDFHTHADKKMIARIHSAIVDAPGGTPMYEGMLAGYHLLRGREGHKLMVVMADGGSSMRLQSPTLTIDRMNKNGKVVAGDTIKTGWTIEDGTKYYEDGELYHKLEMTSQQFYNKHLYAPFKELVKSNKDVDTVGIGIMDKGMPLYIPDSKIIKSIEELKPVIIHEIKKRVRRG